MENHEKYSGNGSDGKSKPKDSAGVGSGLSEVHDCPVKDAESVTDNQRPEGNCESTGGFKIGTL